MTPSRTFCYTKSEGTPLAAKACFPNASITTTRFLPSMMAYKSTPSHPSPLNPAALSFSMPSAADTPNSSTPNGATSQPTPSKPSKSAADVQNSTPSENVAEAGAGAKLAGAALKKQKAAEKAARRADKVAQKGEVVVEEPPQKQASSQSTTGKPVAQRRPSQTKKEESHHKRTPSKGQQFPIRQQPGQQMQAPIPEKKEETKQIPMFEHLYHIKPKASLSNAGREIHPAVLALGLQLRNYVICGSNARCVAMLLVFKKVIQSYTTPPGVALSRHLLTHLNHQIDYIINARALGVSQGNAIRWLKKLISALDPDEAENDAKKYICEGIDAFIREKVVLADEVISREGAKRIEDDDVIVTYGKSSVVEKTLKEAWKEGKRYKTIVVDSRPMFEGKNLARSLVREEMDVEYALLDSLGDVVRDATKCILGASAMLGNGRLQARSGTAMVAMMCKEVAQCPVMVLCESVKFTSKVALDSVVMNELGEADALVEEEDVKVFTTEPRPDKPQQGKGGKKAKEDGDEDQKVKRGLAGWKEQPNLHLLSLMYDITPAEHIDMVVCELGSLPPSAVPVANGVHGGDE